MTDYEIEELTISALHDRDRDDQERCFTTNRVGLQLVQCDITALPIIEKVLREVVIPTAVNSKPYPFRGLEYVLGAYLVIGVRSGSSRIISFMRCSPPSLTSEMLKCIPVFFRKMDHDYNFGVGPSKELVEFVNESSTTDSEELRMAAMYVLEQIVESKK